MTSDLQHDWAQAKGTRNGELTRVNTSSTSEPATVSPSDTSAAPVSAAVAGKLPFNRRVHLVVEVLDRPEERDLLTDLCASLSWPIRCPLSGETTVEPAAGWTLRIIEARIRAVREGAVEQAVATLDVVVRDAALSAQCRDAALVESMNRPLVEWHLRGKSRRPHRRLIQAAHLMTRTGDHDQDAGTVRLVRVPVSLDEPRPRRLAHSRRAARAQLSGHILPNRRRNTDRHVIGRAKARITGQLFVVVGQIVAFFLLVAAALGRWQELGIGSTAFSQTVVVWAAAYVLAGAVLAVRRTVTHRAVPWLLPFALPLAVPLVLWLGAQVQQAYLRPFGVSLGSNGGGLGRVNAGLWILLVFCGTLLLPIAYLGWNRHTNSSIDTRGSWVSWVPMLMVGTLLGLVLSSLVLFTAGEDGKSVRALASAGGKVPGYFGLEADRVCLRLVSADAPFLGTRPPERSPVLTFGPDGDRIGFWVPPRRAAEIAGPSAVGTSVSVRLEDAQIEVADEKLGCEATDLKN